MIQRVELYGGNEPGDLAEIHRLDGSLVARANQGERLVVEYDPYDSSVPVVVTVVEETPPYA